MTGKAKYQSELKLGSVGANNTKLFKKYFSSKKRSKENTGSDTCEGDHPSNRDKEKVEAFIVIWFLFHKSLIILVGLGLPGPFSWRTINMWQQGLS